MRKDNRVKVVLMKVQVINKTINKVIKKPEQLTFKFPKKKPKEVQMTFNFNKPKKKLDKLA